MNHVCEKDRRAEDLALFVFRKRFVKILDDVAEDIQADEIERAEGRGLRTPDNLPRHLVNFLNRIVIFQHRLDRVECAERADAIGDEVRTVFSGHDTFAETLIQEACDLASDFGLRPFGADDLDQMQVARRIEKVYA